MKALVLGGGSIGARRATLLSRMGVVVSIYDPWRTVSIPGVEQVTDLTFHLAHAEMVLDCSPPDQRAENAWLITEAERDGSALMGYYAEKPLGLTGSALEELEQALLESRLITMGACNMRFDARVIRVPKGMRAYSAVMGQHGKHWSPRHQPVSLLLDSIHELDLLVHLMGPLSALRGHSNQWVAVAFSDHEEGGRGMVSMNRWDDPPRRSLHWVNGTADTHADLWPPDGMMYMREMRHFMECVYTAQPTCNPLADAIHTTRYAVSVCQSS